MKIKKIKSDHKIILALCYYLSIAQFIFFFNSLTIPFLGSNAFDTVAVYLGFFVMFMWAWPAIKANLPSQVYMVLIGIVFSLLIGYLLYPSAFTAKLIFEIAFSAICGLLLGSTVRNIRLLKCELQFFARILSIIMLVGFLINILVIDIEWTTNKMPFSYMLLTPVVGEIWRLKERFSLIGLLLILVNTIILIIYGSRGPIMCLLAFIPLLYFTRRDIKHLFIKGVGISFLLMLMMSFLNDILLAIYNLGNSLGVVSKTISLIMSDNLLFENGRIAILNSTIQLIRESPLIGLGVFSDRFHLGIYPHNVFLEIILDFGIFIGGALIIWMIKIVWNHYTNNNQITREITAFLISIGFIKLLVSGSYWNEGAFFVLLGFCMMRNVTVKNSVKHLNLSRPNDRAWSLCSNNSIH